VDRLADHRRLGFRSRDPRWAVAFKFKPRQMTTRILDIDVQVGRTGVLTPVAILEPINIGGVEVKRASLHNHSEIERKDIRIGDRVLVERAGDVIPYVVMSVPEVRNGTELKFQMPKQCPVCGSEVVSSADKKAAVCSGISCPAQLKRRVTHFASKAGMDIQGLGRKMAEKLVDSDLISRISDIYRLSRADLEGLERMAAKSAENLLAEIDKSKNSDLARFLFALGIPLVGEHLARVLCTRFAAVQDLMVAREEDLLAIREIGPEVATSLVRFFSDRENRRVIEELLRAALRLPNPYLATSEELPLRDLTFVFTGGLETMTRAEARQRVESLGGRVASSVSRQTDYLVAGAGAGSKLDQARALNVSIIDEARFCDLLSSPAAG
jgi:DNA ligase (NAD+)